MEEKKKSGPEERGGERERYAVLEDWERKTTGRRDRETEREKERERGVKMRRERPHQGVLQAEASCERSADSRVDTVLQMWRQLHPHARFYVSIFLSSAARSHDTMSNAVFGNFGLIFAD